MTEKIDTLSCHNSYPINIWFFNRKVNIVYLEWLPSNNAFRASNFGLFAAAMFFAIFSQVEFQLKKCCYRDVGRTSHYLHDGQMCGANKSAHDIYIYIYIYIGHTTYGPLSWAAPDGAPAELENFGPWIGPLFKLASLVQGDIKVAEQWLSSHWKWLTAQDRNVTQSARPRMRESAGTRSQWLSESARVPEQPAD